MNFFLKLVLKLVVAGAVCFVIDSIARHCGMTFNNGWFGGIVAGALTACILRTGDDE